MPRGGARIGAGRKANPKPPLCGARSEGMYVRVNPDTAHILSACNKAQATELLAQGLRLGAGNLSVLSQRDHQLITAAMNGMVLDPLNLRALHQEIHDMGFIAGQDGDHPGIQAECQDLARRVREFGDWELLHLTLQHGRT